ncbi:unnamed protein product [Pleuronectes platessa]|uniref:Fibulin 2 n=1 Tax=Pleuronectes platessa TaxID=8262 RepID=A0A9N7UVE7_PLEPL|nr:unnamed protein product [Pleuronectes platessa]
MDFCLSQKDCTGVDCPVPQNCLDTVLEAGACCPTCTQTGCTCEGYQYYDCIQAGFRKGKVPEGESYFVDFGSTECSCPQGGGRISCHFIPCPEIPPNCIEILQPADGCMQCGRVGCTQGSKKYEAGQSFQRDQCQVCHCPSDGGRLTCSPIPGCDLRRVNTPVGTSIENNNPVRDISGRHGGQQTSAVEPLSKLEMGNTLPLYKQDPPSFGTEDYDYTVVEPTSPTIQDLAPALESTTVPPTPPESSSTSSSSQDDRRQETRGKQSSPTPASSGEDEVTHSVAPTATKRSTLQTATTTQRVTTENHRLPQEVGERTIRQNRVVQDTLKDTGNTVHANKAGRHFGHHKRSQDSHTTNHGGLASAGNKGQGQAPVEPQQTLGREEQGSYPTVQFSPTSRAPVRMREDDDQPQRQAQTLHNYQTQDVGDSQVSAKELVKTCCETGEKWASANGHCNNMETPAGDRHSICWTAQQQCCRSSLREGRCLAGMNAARGGSTCEEDAGDKCRIDSYKECCGCCSLGLQLRREGHPCEAHHFLGYHCRHVFLNCCKGAEHTAGNQDGRHTVRERPTQVSSPPPKKVSDGPYPKEAFSIGEERDVENTVEGPVEVEDMDECLIYQGNICHHRCVNTPGSFRCECFPGYVMQEDAFTCAQESVDEENRLKEDDRAAEEPTSPLPSPPSHATVPVDPCEGNSPCEQQCTPVGGRPQCSCSPGFSLRADGRSCEDINECFSVHACQLDELCVNTAGSYICQRPITCPPGYHINNDICEVNSQSAELTRSSLWSRPNFQMQ